MEAAERRVICGRIQQARKEAGLTQAELADLLKVHKRTIENWEKDRVPWEHLQEIAELTGKTREWLLRGDEALTETEDLVRAVVHSEIANQMGDVLAALARLESSLARREKLTQEDDEPQ